MRPCVASLLEEAALSRVGGELEGSVVQRTVKQVDAVNAELGQRDDQV